MTQQVSTPTVDPLDQSLYNLKFKYTDTAAKVKAAREAETDFSANLEQHIQQVRERFKL
jgi:hypothetical protein